MVGLYRVQVRFKKHCRKAVEELHDAIQMSVHSFGDGQQPDVLSKCGDRYLKYRAENRVRIIQRDALVSNHYYSTSIKRAVDDII